MRLRAHTPSLPSSGIALLLHASAIALCSAFARPPSHLIFQSSGALETGTAVPCHTPVHIHPFHAYSTQHPIASPTGPAILGAQHQAGGHGHAQTAQQPQHNNHLDTNTHAHAAHHTISPPARHYFGRFTQGQCPKGADRGASRPRPDMAGISPYLNTAPPAFHCPLPPSLPAHPLSRFSALGRYT